MNLDHVNESQTAAARIHRELTVSVEEDSGGEDQEYVLVEENEGMLTRGEEVELFDEISITEEEKKEIPMTRIAITTLMQQPKVPRVQTEQSIGSDLEDPNPPRNQPYVSQAPLHFRQMKKMTKEEEESLNYEHNMVYYTEEAKQLLSNEESKESS